MKYLLMMAIIFLPISNASAQYVGQLPDAVLAAKLAKEQNIPTQIRVDFIYPEVNNDSSKWIKPKHETWNCDLTISAQANCAQRTANSELGFSISLVELTRNAGNPGLLTISTRIYSGMVMGVEPPQNHPSLPWAVINQGIKFVAVSVGKKDIQVPFAIKLSNAAKPEANAISDWINKTNQELTLAIQQMNDSQQKRADVNRKNLTRSMAELEKAAKAKVKNPQLTPDDPLPPYLEWVEVWQQK